MMMMMMMTKAVSPLLDPHRRSGWQTQSCVESAAFVVLTAAAGAAVGV